MHWRLIRSSPYFIFNHLFSLQRINAVILNSKSLLNIYDTSNHGETACFLCEGTAVSRGILLDVYPNHQRACVPDISTGRRHAAAAVEGGVALFCCSGEIWHGAERGRGREWDSLIGINGSSEVWTENLKMGSNDWNQNGKRQTCFSFFFFYPSTQTYTHTATGRFMAYLTVNTIDYHCRQVHLLSCEYVPRCIQLQVLYEYLWF